MSSWLLDRASGSQPEVFCLPHAGGAAHTFVPWRGPGHDAGLRISALQLPGRGRRLGEPAPERVEPLAEAIAEVIVEARATDPTPTPFALFGHSYGGLLAFATTRALQARGHDPSLMVVAATRSPHRAPTVQWHELDDDTLIERLCDGGGLSEAVVAEPELLALILPTLRADLVANDGYQVAPSVRVRCPVVAYSAHADALVARPDVAAWADVTEAAFAHDELSGDHFSVHDPGSVAAIVRCISEGLHG